jgi:hypothetical protein
VFVQRDSQLTFQASDGSFLPLALDVMVSSVRRVADTGIVVTAFVLKDATIDHFAIRWRLGNPDTLPIYFDTNVPIEKASPGEAGIACSHVQHRSQTIAILLGQLPEQ